MRCLILELLFIFLPYIILKKEVESASVSLYLWQQWWPLRQKWEKGFCTQPFASVEGRRKKQKTTQLVCGAIKTDTVKKYNLESAEWIRVMWSWFRGCLCLCLFPTVLLCVSAADRDRAVGREALQLCPSQCGAVALVPLCGSRRAALGAGERLFSAMSQTALTECRLSGLVYLSLLSEENDVLKLTLVFLLARQEEESWILDPGFFRCALLMESPPAALWKGE